MNYRRFNIIMLIALLSLGAALVLAPCIHEHIGALYPGCVLETLMGRSCPMCGLTTGLRDLVTGSMQRSSRNPLTYPVAVIILLEIAGRALLCRRALSPEFVRRAARWDGRLHTVLLLVYVGYCVVFFTR
ncbi:MAG: DUF2752 domain-containing protein [Kiritimatiellia bacterium]|jgi:hypothetical protein|nr:DUF2752 domain-containing protein [Kiritimatiellia bacterium]MDP6631369.1 DUF2752 domain-containing protein [Kiritimatiellia bacterium]MDP6809157.1 DUF2752 domain-containing protein [Kiritimatiellia bacterium]